MPVNIGARRASLTPSAYKRPKPTSWEQNYRLSTGVMPLIVAEWDHSTTGRIWDNVTGQGIQSTTASNYVTGQAAIGSASKGLKAAGSITALGNLLAAHQLVDHTVIVGTIGGRSNFDEGVLTYINSGSTDAILFHPKASPNQNRLRSYIAGSALDSNSKPYWEKQNAHGAKVSTTQGRSILAGGSGDVWGNGQVSTVPTTVQYLNYGLGAALVFGSQEGGTASVGSMTGIAIYPGLLTNNELMEATELLRTKRSSGSVIFPLDTYIRAVDPTSTLHYSKTQPWTAMGKVSAVPPQNSANRNPTAPPAGILFTTSSTGPYGGYEVFINQNGALSVRIMANFDTGDYLGWNTGNITQAPEYFWGAVYDGSGTSAGLTLYIGTPGTATLGIFRGSGLSYEKGTATVPVSLTGDIIVNSRDGYQIGNQIGFQKGFQLGGSMLHIQQIRRALTDTEMQAVWNSGGTPQWPAVDGDTELYLDFDNPEAPYADRSNRYQFLPTRGPRYQITDTGPNVGPPALPIPVPAYVTFA